MNWHRLKTLAPESVSSPIKRRVYNLGLDEFIASYCQERRPGFAKATVNAWGMALEARALGPISINVRITDVRKLAVGAGDNSLLAPEPAAGIFRAKSDMSNGLGAGSRLELQMPFDPLGNEAPTTKLNMVFAAFPELPTPLDTWETTTTLVTCT